MNLAIATRLTPQIDYTYWAGLGQPGQTLDDLIEALEKQDNTILGIDTPNQRVLVARHKGVEEDVWGCRFCFNDGAIVLVDTIDELLNHCNHAHEGWEEHAKATEV